MRNNKIPLVVAKDGKIVLSIAHWEVVARVMLL